MFIKIRTERIVIWRYYFNIYGSKTKFQPHIYFDRDIFMIGVRSHYIKTIAISKVHRFAPQNL